MLRPAAWLCLCLWVPLAVAGGAEGQTQQPPANRNDEMTTHETPATFRTKVNLVLVPVVVRDKQGRAVGDLHQEDFQLFDKGKPQTITSFSIETLASQAAESAKTETAPLPDSEAPATINPADVPKRFVIYFFDDVHISQGDLMQVRTAAERHIDESLAPTDRAAIFTTSGRTTLDFTDDRAKLHATLRRITPQPIARAMSQLCPDISYYQSDLIMNQNDPGALNAAVQDAIACMMLDPTDKASVQVAQSTSRATASQVLNTGESESRVSLQSLREAVRRISAMPGQRAIVLVSPGFLTLADLFQEKTELIDRAIRGNVIISTLDARGLYTIIPGGDASQPSPQSIVGGNMRSQYQLASSLAQEDVLVEMAYGTGGVFFHNSNDLVEGFKRVAARPEFVYVLGFSPQNLKLDGRLHGLKVTLRNSIKLEVQARKGYYAPQHLADPAETAKQEMQDALFSREELRDIPLVMHTQFFKPTAEDAKLSVLARVDVKHLHFRKENGRNQDDLMVVSGLFDRNGNLVSGNSKTIEMRLKDQTLESRLDSGITVKSSFDVKPGSYMIRLVIRDSEGQLMAAANGTVDIPMN
ncbi:MAG TPA: VWA domain-containing protein [Bryobacteraceae bacterium]|jgi:VWFA-related protein|nr:VWA domain-containing protein [Bryobacteraceae bacterium]